jgi:hypothetical protein
LAHGKRGARRGPAGWWIALLATVVSVATAVLATVAPQRNRQTMSMASLPRLEADPDSDPPKGLAGYTALRSDNEVPRGSYRPPSVHEVVDHKGAQ